MANLKKSAKKARKNVDNLDQNWLEELRRLDINWDKLKDVDWNIVRQREEDAASKGFLGGLFVGALIGVVLALIFAPRRGEETRELVADAASDLRHKATDLAQQTMPAAANGGGDSSQAMDDGPAIEREIGNAMEGATQDLMDAVDSARANAESAADEPKKQANA